MGVFEGAALDDDFEADAFGLLLGDGASDLGASDLGESDLGESDLGESFGVCAGASGFFDLGGSGTGSSFLQLDLFFFLHPMLVPTESGAPESAPANLC